MILTTRLIHRGFYALTIWPFVLVRPECANAQRLLRHERKHLEQIEGMDCGTIHS